MLIKINKIILFFVTIIILYNVHVVEHSPTKSRQMQKVADYNQHVGNM